MQYNPEPECGTTCVMQVLFNRDLEKIATIVDPDGRYIQPIHYFMSKHYEGHVTTYNPEDDNCFLELAFFFDGIDFIHRVHFYSESELTNKMWRNIRDTVNTTIAQFDRSTQGDRCNVFADINVDVKSPNKQEESLDHLICKRYISGILRKRYKCLLEEVRMLRKEGIGYASMARQYDIDSIDVKYALYGGPSNRAKSADVAIMALMQTMKKDGSASILRIFDGIKQRKQLMNEIIYRKKQPFPNRKNIVTSKRPWISKMTEDKSGSDHR